MTMEKETPEERRERLRQEELKGNVGGNVHDAFNRSSNGGLNDLVGGLGWKGTGILLLIIILGFIIYSLFYR